MGNKNDPNKAAMKIQKEQMGRLQALETPELREYALQNPELVGLLEAEEMGPSALEDISLDPRLREAQYAALEGMSERADQGFAEEDLAMLRQTRRDEGARAQSQQQGILQGMAERGGLDSGAQLAAQLGSQQASASRGAEAADRQAIAAAQARRQAMTQSGNMAAQMQGADFSRQAQQGTAADAISRFNTANRQNVSGQNLAARQQQENQRAAIANQQAGMSNTLEQQRFQNEMSKASGQAQTSGAMSQIAGSAPQKPGMLQSTASGAATGAAIGGPWGAAIGGGIGAVSSMFEDGGLAFGDAFSQARREHGGDGGQFEWQGNKYTTDYAKPQGDAPAEEGIDYGKTLGAVSKILGSSSPQRRALKLNPVKYDVPQNIMDQRALPEFQNPYAKNYEDGGTYCAENGQLMFDSNGEGDVVDGGSFERDRVDARLNSGEAVLNVAQQQRLMDILRGEEGVDSLGEDDIVEGVPKQYHDSMKSDIDGDKHVKGLRRLLEILGE